MKRIITKTQYLHIFTAIVIILALYRCATGAGNASSQQTTEMPQDSVLQGDTATGEQDKVVETQGFATIPSNVDLNIKNKYHKIWSVPNFKEAFPDSNEVQLTVARRYGVKPVQNRTDAEKRKTELVYIGANPYFHVDKMRESIPYLVPRACVLLQDIGRTFYDSLYVKGVPLHQIIVTSVLRTEEDVARLRRHNLNASDNSCHRFGTTFDISYNRYVTVQTDSNRRRAVQNDTLKWVLSEVLRDMRQTGRCYVKYEVKQGCFHITTR